MTVIKLVVSVVGDSDKVSRVCCCDIKLDGIKLVVSVVGDSDKVVVSVVGDSDKVSRVCCW